MIDLLKDSLIGLLKVLPILVAAVLLSKIISEYLPKDKLEKSVKESDKNIAKASAIGLITPGPLLTYLPLLKTLKQKGLGLSILIAFITTQTLIGPGRILLELDYFGITFLCLRVLLAFVIAIAIGISFRLLERYIKF